MYEGKKYCVSTDDINTKIDKSIHFHEYTNYECGDKVSILKITKWKQKKLDIVIINDIDSDERYIFKYDKDKILGDKIGYMANNKKGEKTIMKLYE